MKAEKIETYSEPRRHYLNASYGVRSWLFSTDHKRIALLYLVTITLMFVIGGAAAVLFRLELMTPAGEVAGDPAFGRDHHCGGSMDESVARFGILVGGVAEADRLGQ